MSRAVRITNILVVVIPFVAFVAALTTLWNAFVGPLDLAIAFVMYMLTILGVTIGFHRYLTHRAFQTSKPVEYALAILGSMAIEGPVVNWVADHRKHHAHTDEEGDPHSPHGHGSGAGRDASRGCGTRTSAGCGTTTASPSARSTRATWSRTAACGSSTCSFGPLAALSLAIPFGLGSADRRHAARAG